MKWEILITHYFFKRLNRCRSNTILNASDRKEIGKRIGIGKCLKGSILMQKALQNDVL